MERRTTTRSTAACAAVVVVIALALALGGCENAESECPDELEGADYLACLHELCLSHCASDCWAECEGDGRCVQMIGGVPICRCYVAGTEDLCED